MSGLIISALFGGQNAAASSLNLPPQVALKMAETQKTAQIDRLQRDPVMKRDWAAFEKAVKEAKSPEDFLKNRSVRTVLLNAYGLGDQVNNTALVTKVLTSNPFDPSSLSSRMSFTNGAWERLTKDLDLYSGTLSKVRLDSTKDEIETKFFEARWRKDLDTQSPGLGAALLFKERAAGFTNTFQILGDRVAREVVTRALAIPRQIAIQSVETQARAVEARLKIADLQKPDFVNKLVQRYLMQVSAQGANPGIIA